MNNIIVMNGKELSEKLLKTQNIVKDLNNRPPCLVVLTVGNEDASNIYVKNKRIMCEKAGITFIHEKFSKDIDREILLNRINELNSDNEVDGIFVQLPLPKHLNGIEQFISFDKDVDGFTPYNLGNTFNKSEYQLNACTPSGIITLLKHYNVPLKGKHVVILGRSNMVGKPLIGLLLNEDCTVTSCNSHTDNLKSITKSADILISVIGKPKYINSDYISPDCYCVIDVGINRDTDGKICGDVDFEDIVRYWNNINTTSTKYITPVPNGVGPMTVYSLVQNVLLAYERKSKK